MTLPNMTEEVAQAIIAHREQQPFRSRGDLLLIQEVRQPITPTVTAGAANQRITRTQDRNAMFNGLVEKVTVVSDSFTVRVLGVQMTPNAATGRQSDLAVHLTAVIDRSS